MINENLNHIEIPDNIDKAIDNGIERIQKEQKAIKRKKLIGGVAAIVAIITTVTISNPIVAQELPILKEIFKFFENDKSQNLLIPENNLSNHTNKLGIVSENNGIKITVEEMVYDGENIYMSYKVESKDSFPYKTKTHLVNNKGIEEYKTEDIDFMWIEQKAIINESKEELKSSNHLRGTIIDDNTFIGIIKYEVPALDNGSKPENFNMNINIDYVSFPREKDHKDNLIFYEENKFKVNGNWSFNIPISIDKSLEEVTEVNEIKEGFKLQEIIKTPFYIKAKIIPFKEENQKINSSDGGGKELQQHEGNIVALDGRDYYRTTNVYVDDKSEVVGTTYLTFERSLNDKDTYFKIKVKDNTVLNQPCTEECSNSEIHENLLHAKVFEFDTQIDTKN